MHVLNNIFEIYDELMTVDVEMIDGKVVVTEIHTDMELESHKAHEIMVRIENDYQVELREYLEELDGSDQYDKWSVT